MNFRKNKQYYEPEINFIPLIDVLLVVLIFLMMSTSFAPQNPLKVSLPSASKIEGEKQTDDLRLIVSVNAEGVYAINQRTLESTDISSLGHELKLASQGQQAIIIINADARSSHQSVVNILEAAKTANLSKITFLTQSTK
jgi:biopolymer transport protein ExbD